jgi:hypothetical protein
MEIIREKQDFIYMAMIFCSELEIQEQRVYHFQIGRVFRCGQTFLKDLAIRRLTRHR